MRPRFNCGFTDPSARKIVRESRSSLAKRLVRLLSPGSADATPSTQTKKWLVPFWRLSTASVSKQLSVQIVFEKIRTALEAANIPYFVTGSFASSAHGIPRSTNDIDIVIAPTREQLAHLLSQFPESEYATSTEDAFDALKHRSSFNVVDYATFWKVDFILRQYTPFDASRFARKQIVEIAGVRLDTASAEDVLITKLWWAKLGESQRQIDDAAGVVQVQGETLDREYVERWVAVLELDDQWKGLSNGRANCCQQQTSRRAAPAAEAARPNSTGAASCCLHFNPAESSLVLASSTPLRPRRA